MATIASLVVKVGADLVEFERGIQKAERQISTLSASLTRIGGAMQTAGKVLTVGVTAPILGVGAAAIKMGMDAVESENLVSVSFGNMRASADAWSKHLSDSLGLNQFELRKTAGVLFTMTTSMGIGREAAFEMSTGMVQLAADMASFRNIGMDEALEKIRAGLTGETEPLKRLGILVDEATVKTYAYKTGIAKQGEELTQQQKVLGRYQAILAQTANDQGDLARTLDSPANQLRIMRSRIEEAATSLGVALIPMVQQVIAGVAALVPYIQRAVQWFSDLPEPLKLAAVAGAGLAAAMGPVLYLMGGMLQALPGLIALWKAYETAQVAAKLASIGVSTAMIGVAGAIGAAVVALGALYAASQLWNVTTGKSTEELEKEVAALKKVGGTMALSRAAAIERELAERKAKDTTTDNTKANLDFEAQLRKQAQAMQDEIKRQLDAAAALDVRNTKTKETITLAQQLAQFDAANTIRNEGRAANMAASMAAQGITGKPQPAQWADLEGGAHWAKVVETEKQQMQRALMEGLSGDKGMEDAVVEKRSLMSKLFGAGEGSKGEMFAGLSETFARAWEGGGGVAGAAKSYATMVAKNALNMIPAVGPIISQFAGPLVSGITKLFGGLFGGEGKKTNKERDSWIAQNFGTQDQLRQLAAQAGIADSQMRLLFDTKKVKTFESAARTVSDQLKTFADEQAADAERLDAAIRKYGFSIEELGPKLQAQHLNEQAKELIEDWRVLVNAGIDVATVNDKMAESINSFLQTAISVGSEVPAAMRPILQSLMDQGKLVDANGNLIADFEASGIHFAETMTQGFDRVVQKLDELITRLGLAGSAISSLPSTIDVGVNYAENLPNYEQYAIPMAEGGMGRVTGPTLFLAGENGPEDFMFSGGNQRFGGGDSSAVVAAIETLTRKIDRRDAALPIQLKAAVQLGMA